MDASGNQNKRGDPDAKFRYGIQLIQEAFVEQMKEVMEDNLKWKGLVQNQQKEISSLEIEIAKSNQKLAEVEQQLTEQQRENRKLAEERDQIMEKCNSMQRQSLHLSQFKKAIVSMVERDPSETNQAAIQYALNGGVTEEERPRFSSDLNSLLEHHVQTNKSSNTSSKQSSSHSSRATSPQLYRRGSFYGNDSSRYGGGGSSSDYAESKQSQPSQSARTSGRESQVAVNASNKQDVIAENANELYREVRQVLSPQDFHLFADNINKLNGGHQTTEQCLQNISKMLKDASLFSRLQRLVRDAEEVTS